MGMLGRPAARAPLNTGDIPDNIITSAKIAADVIAAGDVAPNAITASELADDAVDTAAIVADAVTYAKLQNLGTANRVLGSASTGVIGEVQIAAGMIADDAVTMAKLSATGTASADTYLRGDNSWAAAGSPSITDNGDANAMTIGSDESVTFVGATAIPSIKETDKHNLTGTYSDHEMIMGRTFTLTGDINVNENLVLANLSGSGNDIIIQDDGTARTITTAGKVLSCTTTNTDATVTTASTATLHPGTGVSGTGIAAGATIASITNATTFELSAVATASGTVNLTFATGVLEGGELLQQQRQDLTGMTGTLGSGVTFPAGHQIQTEFKYAYATLTNVESFNSSSNFTQISRLTATITPKKANSLIRVDIHTMISPATTSNAMTSAIVVRNPSGSVLNSFNAQPNTADVVIGNGATTNPHTNQTFSGNMDITREVNLHSMSYFDVPGAITPQTYAFMMKSWDGATIYVGRWNYSASWRAPSIIILTEIAQ
jgi:hypothetical protein